MLGIAAAEILLADCQLAVSMVRADGTILFENRAAKDLLGREVTASNSILNSLTVADAWEGLLDKIVREGAQADEPVLLQTPHGNAEVCYVTAIPQFTGEGTLDCLLCVWATRRKALSPALSCTDSGTLAEYTRDLEQVLEHRTYQNLLAAEQNEFARDALDVLPVGILVVSRTGQILYRNHAMTDDFGLRPSDYLQLDVQHILAADLVSAFDQVITTNTRRFLYSRDPGDLPAAVDLLPVLRMNTAHRVLFQFSRCDHGGGTA